MNFEAIVAKAFAATTPATRNQGTLPQGGGSVVPRQLAFAPATTSRLNVTPLRAGDMAGLIASWGLDVDTIEVGDTPPTVDLTAASTPVTSGTSPFGAVSAPAGWSTGQVGHLQKL